MSIPHEGAGPVTAKEMPPSESSLCSGGPERHSSRRLRVGRCARDWGPHRVISGPDVATA
eukprot:5194645-Pyramimonas_sp.AAC.1